MENELIRLASKLGQHLLASNRRLVTAESCTGGWIAEAITAIAGSSQWFERGFVTYSNESKVELLGVNLKTIQTNGAVSEATVCEMASGALLHSHADIAIAVSGVAGPDGGTKEKPVGLVWFGFAIKHQQPQSHQQIFSGDRQQIRQQAVIYALKHLVEL